MAGNDMVYAEINGIYKAKGPASFIFMDEDGHDIIVPFSQIGTIVHDGFGDIEIEELKKLPTLAEVEAVKQNPEMVLSVEIPRWLADKLDLSYEED